MQLKSSHGLFTFLSRVFIMLSSPHSTEKLDRKSKLAFFFLLYENLDFDPCDMLLWGSLNSL